MPLPQWPASREPAWPSGKALLGWQAEVPRRFDSASALLSLSSKVVVRDGRCLVTLTLISLHCRHQSDSCIKMGSDESHFNVSLIVRDKVTRQCPETTMFEEKGEPKRI